MNKTFVKLSILFVAFFMLLTFTGCDSTNSVDSKNTDNHDSVVQDQKQPVIEVKEESTNEIITFETQQKDDSTLNKGETKTEQEGKNGIKKVMFKITYTNGKESNREKISEEVTEKPIDKIVLVGTKENVSITTQPTSTTKPTSTNNSGNIIKKSTTNICHAPGTTYYDKTKNYTPYNTLNECLASGGRLPKK